jgi:membrane-associated phospholipid phosphatase
MPALFNFRTFGRLEAGMIDELIDQRIPVHVQRRFWMVTKAVVGAGLLFALLVLGFLTLTARVTSYDLHLDRIIAMFRFGLASMAALELTRAAQAKVGLGVLAVGLVVLLVRRRRFEAIQLVLIAGSAWALALGIKYVLDRPRPPANLWLVAPDPTGSFPSGHTTTAAVIGLIVFMAAVATGGVRVLVAGLAMGYALAVGASRLYLGDHYPTDVLGSYLDVTAATLLASAVMDLPGVRRIAARALRTPELAVETPGHIHCTCGWSTQHTSAHERRREWERHAHQS